jgi:imidazolonepropionase-like amidohydrolase
MKTLIRNIGTLVSGDIRRPILDADSLVIGDGKILGIGRGLDEDADTVIDAKGTTVMPGLVDSHVHPVFGDFTPRQRTVDFIDSAMKNVGARNPRSIALTSRGTGLTSSAAAFSRTCSGRRALGI